jgi:NADPH:quinone reductase-like Zn-dependent oxidoreductase
MLRHGEAPDPAAAPGALPLDIQAAGVNAAGYKVRRGGGATAISDATHLGLLGRDKREPRRFNR